MRVAYLIAALLLALASSTQAQTVEPRTKLEVDSREVGRRGDMVEHVGGGIEEQDPLDRGIAQIVKLPEGDANKWQLWVIGMKNCPGCEHLKSALKTNRTMRFWVLPEAPKESWANYHYFDKDDKVQDWRWKKLKITGYPTIIVQPPRSRAYGNDKAVVLQYMWDGDPENFDNRLRENLRAYYASLQEQKHEAVVKKLPAGFELTQASLTTPVSTKGVGEQQFPPLDLPGEPKEPPAEDAPLPDRVRPVRDTLVGALRKPEIIIVRDPEIAADEGEDEAVEEAVEALQPKGHERHAVRRLDPAKALARYGTMAAPEDGPLVLKVEGRRVIEKHVCHPKRDPRIDEDHGFVMTLSLLFASMFFGKAVTAYYFAKLLNIVFWVVIGIIGLIVVVALAGWVQKRTAANATAVDAETLKLVVALQAAQRANDATKVAVAPKV